MDKVNEFFANIQLAVVHVVLGDFDVPEGGRWFNAPLSQIQNSVTYDVAPINVMDIVEDSTIIPSDIPHIDALAEILKKHPDRTVVYFGGDTRMGDGRTHWEHALERSQR